MRNSTVISIIGLLFTKAFAEQCWSKDLGKTQ